MSENQHEPSFVQPGISQVETLSARLIELNLALDEKNRELIASEEARKNILANISHDLRAPLTAIQGAAERMLDATAGEDERAEMAQLIGRRVRALGALVDELYYSTTIDQPEFTLKMHPLELAPFLEEYFITQEAAGRFEAREAVLTVPEGLAATVMLDTGHFLRVMDNLVANALRHTAEGDTLVLGCRAVGGGIELWLRDTGEGIAEADLPHIFERTYTTSQARTPGSAGSGLGLAIAKTIVEKHGGTISCRSTAGAGATFTVTLPACL